MRFIFIVSGAKTFNMDFTKFKIAGIVGIVIGIALLGISFYVGFSIGENQTPSILEVEGLSGKTIGQPNDVDFSLFWDTWKLVEERFVNRDSLDRQDMVFGAVTGMVKSLDDPYTVFFEPKEAKIFKEDINGSFEGIGAEIGIRKEVLTIISPLENSPAQIAGLRAGDKVIRIDDEPTEGITLLNAVNKIRGKKGTAVNFTILRGGEEVKEISVIRDKIIIPVLSWQMKEGNIVHLELFSFSQQATKKFREALLEILRNPTEKMVLDLRNNPGGFLEVAQELLGWFVEPGEIIAKEDFGEGKRTNEYRAIGNGALRNFDIVVLINKGSASASEIMAGALRDIRGIELVGEKSFGKGSIQQVENLSGGSSIKITIAKWLTPSGVSISEEGLDPDIEVEMTSEDIDEGRDPQLDRALEIIKRL